VTCQWRNDHGECDLYSKQEKMDSVLQKLDCDDDGMCNSGEMECI
jgi:hypothetical protein